jgi:hypothetical protein
LVEVVWNIEDEDVKDIRMFSWKRGKIRLAGREGSGLFIV